MQSIITLLRRLRRLQQLPAPLRYCLASAAVLLACAARYELATELTAEPFMLFFPAILLDAFAFGQYAGFFASTLSAALADVFFIGNPETFDVPDLATGLGLALFVAIGCLTSSFVNVLWNISGTLEDLVAERTRELLQANERLRSEVAERLRAEEALYQAQKLEAIGRMAGTIAHDFNNFMTGVLGNIALAQARIARQAKPDERLTNLLSEAERAAVKGESMAQELLAFARKQRLQPEALDSNAIVRNMEDILRKVVEPSVSFRVVLASDLGPAFADRSQLERALMNLVINARDAAAQRADLDGEIVIATANETVDPTRAEASGISPGRHVRIEVRDNGTGMRPEVLAHVFEPFFTTKPEGKGTGLGLAQVYGFMRQSGGSVEVDSREGEGTSVVLRLLPPPA